MKALLPVIAGGVAPLFILVIIVASVGLGLVAWRPPGLWVVTNRVPGRQSDITALATSGDGLYAAGYVGPASTTRGYVFLAKYDTGGTQIWQKKFGTDFSSVSSISTDPTGVYLAVQSTSNPYVLKYDINGQTIWNDSFGGIGSIPTSVYSTSSAVYVAGYVTQGAGFLRKYDLNGNLTWAKLLGNATSAPSFVYGDTNDVFVSGSNSPSSAGPRFAFVEEFDDQNVLGWNQTFICDCTTTGISGDNTGVYITGEARSALPGQVSGGTGDTFIRKYDLNGNSLWTSEFAAPDYSGSINPQVSVAQSSVYLSIYTSGGNGFVMKYANSGREEWSLNMQNVLPDGFTVRFHTVLAAGPWVLYIGGSDSFSNSFIAALSSTSSLVFFGINPPTSFLLVGIILAGVVAGILWFRQERRKARRRPGIARGQQQTFLTD